MSCYVKYAKGLYCNWLKEVLLLLAHQHKATGINILKFYSSYPK